MMLKNNTKFRRGTFGIKNVTSIFFLSSVSTGDPGCEVSQICQCGSGVFLIKSGNLIQNLGKNESFFAISEKMNKTCTFLDGCHGQINSWHRNSLKVAPKLGKRLFGKFGK